jgi:predicted ATPase/DNA-binding response OmpR family regulator/class 3 adenylate cyclase
MRPRVLLVARDIDLRARIARELQSSGLAVELASDDKRALRLGGECNFLAAVVALGSIGSDLPMILALRDAVPKMIVLVERPDEVACLQRSLPEIATVLLNKSDEGVAFSRIGEVITRAGRARETEPPARGVLRIEGCTLDLAGHTFINAEGRDVALTRAETELLRELARNPRQTSSREELRQAIVRRGASHFDQNMESFDRSIDMLVARLRRKIEPDAKAPRCLVTVPGVGYKLMADDPDAGKLEADRIEPERRQITALSCNLVGAIAFAIGCDPEDLSGTTRSFQEAGVAAITRLGGSIAYVTPDQILAVFGYPEAHEDDPERAVNAGFDMRAAVAQILSPRGEPLQARIGVATGLALVSQKETVGGPSAIAAALCALAAPDSMLITRSTRRLVSGAFVCDRPERHAFSGISEPVSACRVTGRRAVGSRFKATRAKNITRLVGRERELQQLIALCEKANRGEGQVALICGEAGIGKSHLCEFLLEQLADQPHLTLRYQCSPLHLNSPFYPVVTHLEHAFGLAQTDTPELKLEKLKSALYQVGEATRETAYLYARLLSIPTPEPKSLRGLTPQRRKNLTFAALIRHLQSVAQHQPLIIVLADAHWIDSSTLDLVNRILPLVKTARILFLIEFRPEFNPQWAGEPHVTMLCLERLRRDHSLAIVSEHTGGKRLPQELEAQIVTKADGVPLFIEELTKSVLESELVQEVADQYVATDALNSLNVPTSLLDSLTARLDRLGKAKDIAQIGAVIGRKFSCTLLVAVASEPAKSLQPALAQLTGSGLISVTNNFPETIYAFKHALVRDAAYATLPRAKRKYLHGRIADVLENSFPLLVETEPELLAHHLVEAGFTVRAVEYLQKAAQRAMARSANTEAIAHLTQALELLPSVHDSVERNRERFLLEAMLSQAMIARYGYAAPKTRDALLRASTLIEESTESSRKFPILYGIWASHYVASELIKQRSVAVEFLKEAERSDDTAIKCVGHRLIGTTHLTMGELAAGLSHLKQAWALYDSEHHAVYGYQYGQDIGAATLCYLSWALWHLGYFEQASRAATEAMALAEKASHPHSLVYTICHARGFMDLFRRRHEAMPAYASLVISICRENGFLHWANCGAIFSGWAAACGNQVDRGIEMLGEGLAAWQEGGARLWMPMFQMLQAQAYAKAGRNESALKTIEQAIGACEGSGERWAMAEVVRTKASILQSRKTTPSEIETTLLKSIDIARGQGALCWELRASSQLSSLWRRRGKSREALNLLRPIYHQFTEGFETDELRQTHKLLCQLEEAVR